MDQLANEYSAQPLAIVEYGNSYRPASRMAILQDNGGGAAVPEMMIDSSHEWQTGADYPSAKGFIDRSLARPAGANVVAVYERTGNIVKFMVTVTNTSGVTLSKANKAAVHAVIYEDKPGVHKTARIARAGGKVDINLLQNGRTDTYVFTVNVNGMTDWTKAHYIVMVDYKTAPTKKPGKYDQLQAAIAIPGTVTTPTEFKVSPDIFTFSFNDRETEFPADEFTVTLPTDKTWTSSTNVEWLSIEQESGGNGDKINFAITTNEHFEYGKNYGLVIVSESGSERERAAVIEVEYLETPVPDFRVLPITVTRTIRHDDPPGPEVAFRVTGDEGQTWTAEPSKDWITVTPASGNVPATFIATFDRSKLVDGVNEAVITVRDGDDFHEKDVAVKVIYIGSGEQPPLDEFIYFPLILRED